MSILKYKDPQTGEFKRINPYKADLTFVGKDGIVVNKAANSEMVEISGSGLVQRTTTANRVYTTDKDGLADTAAVAYTPIAYGVAAYDEGGRITTNEPADNLDCTNKKYVADNYVEKVKFTNLEQALYGYVLDTTKEAYADLDSAVLKNSVAVGDNVYPIADKTRALVTRIEGKTTKMVQLYDKRTNNNTTTKEGVTFAPNENGSWVTSGTVGASCYCGCNTISTKFKKGHKYLIHGCPKGGSNDTFFMRINFYTPNNFGFDDVGNGNIFTFNNDDLNGILYIYERAVGETISNRVYTPQIFDLTAMNREDITTIEQFKAEFPELYPYENGNIYPAEISGVKFYENQDESGEQVSVTLPGTYDLHGIGDYKDYLEITKNEDNELYTLKKVQSVEVNESEKTITPLATPVETVIATNLTYEQVTAIRHNNGLIEVEGNANKGYARPTIKNTIVYRLTATNTAEG